MLRLYWTCNDCPLMTVEGLTRYICECMFVANFCDANSIFGVIIVVCRRALYVDFCVLKPLEYNLLC